MGITARMLVQGPKCHLFLLCYSYCRNSCKTTPFSKEGGRVRMTTQVSFVARAVCLSKAIAAPKPCRTVPRESGDKGRYVFGVRIRTQEHLLVTIPPGCLNHEVPQPAFRKRVHTGLSQADFRLMVDCYGPRRTLRRWE